MHDHALKRALVRIGVLTTHALRAYRPYITHVEWLIGGYGMTLGKVAATIAYSLDAAGFTQAQRWLIAETFANELRMTGKRRERFLIDCRKASEQNAQAVR